MKWMDNDDIGSAPSPGGGDPGSTLDQRSSNTENRRNILLRWDCVPLHTDGRFEMGMRSTLRDIENDYLVGSWTDGDWMAVEGFDEFFTYKGAHPCGLRDEPGDKRGRFSTRPGCGPSTDHGYRAGGGGITNPRSYLDLFPART